METISREGGCLHTFCPIASVAWLHRKFNDSFFLIVGTHTCAHFIQTALDVMVYAHSRFGFAVLEESDLVSANLTGPLDGVIRKVIDEWHPKVIFVMTTCSIDILKVDLQVSCQELSKTHEFPILLASTSGIDRTFTQGEDAVLKALLPFSPQEAPVVPAPAPVPAEAPVVEKKKKWFSLGKSEPETPAPVAAPTAVPAEPKPNLVLLGAIPDITIRQLVWELNRLGIPQVDVFPSADLSTMPPIHEKTVVVPLQPYLNETINAIRRQRGAEVLSTVFPIGPDGTAHFLRDICQRFDLPIDRVYQREAEAWGDLETYVNFLRGKKIMFLGDNLLELSLARFLTACGANVVEVGIPYVHRKDMQAELKLLTDRQIPIVENPDFHKQLQRIEEYQPDLIIAGLGICNPLEARGFTTAWSIEFTFAPIHGFGSAVDLIKMFTKPLFKKQTLAENGWGMEGMAL
ncbi:ferredoxin:protochlorophyllide reductase (ATP-dependent) subunit N [Heliophilum fasciatum]|uniref:Light-independent protochlorophyllide reductase subunit N n=1 Tax=Heliophilum fasciatum TaxID=35700 RepID=A0A4R2S7P1_9FIRM|nr:ferredoxin:protochlorophyllide reductase (ATP-dependent) subunit N [Heliophilum fasciatum]MCW2277053.1 light-independent protochlorophyllide reductase subunit N [Heliophilum fasciatum]TCP68421.1 ferredoxin protochlorophyllide reductase subunit N [Heliophilum fasciatum]